MLELTRGSEVEVVSKKEVDLFGAWVCAKVINTTMYTCTVIYGDGGNRLVEETVLREVVRPLPPPLEGVANFTPGDLVECCHNFSWKAAKILKAVTDNIFLVRLLGDSDSDVGFIVHKSFLRVRQLWTGTDWYFIRNNSTSIWACPKKNNNNPCEDNSPMRDRQKQHRLDEYSKSSSASSSSAGTSYSSTTSTERVVDDFHGGKWYSFGRMGILKKLCKGGVVPLFFYLMFRFVTFWYFQ